MKTWAGDTMATLPDWSLVPRPPKIELIKSVLHFYALACYAVGNVYLFFFVTILLLIFIHLPLNFLPGFDIILQREVCG